jgi:hypothetical protein
MILTMTLITCKSDQWYAPKLGHTNSLENRYPTNTFPLTRLLLVIRFSSFDLWRVPAKAEDIMGIISVKPDNTDAARLQSVPARVLAMLCVALLAIASYVQATHIHADAGAGVVHHECALCAVAHAGVAKAPTFHPGPLVVRSRHIVVVARALPRPSFTSSIYIRPPPSF